MTKMSLEDFKRKLIDARKKKLRKKYDEIVARKRCM